MMSYDVLWCLLMSYDVLCVKSLLHFAAFVLPWGWTDSVSESKPQPNVSCPMCPTCGAMRHDAARCRSQTSWKRLETSLEVAEVAVWKLETSKETKTIINYLVQAETEENWGDELKLTEMTWDSWLGWLTAAWCWKMLEDGYKMVTSG